MAIATPRTVVITGASNGIGEALAVHYARPGALLALTGRDGGRLERVAERCRAAGSEVRPALIDVRDRSALANWLRQLDQASPVDLVIANAGVMSGTPREAQIEDADAAFALMEINVLGMLNTVQPLLPLMLERGGGQIAIMSSVSAFVAQRDWPAYSASKAAVLNYGLALRDRVRGAGVRVSVLCPGYVATPMTQRIKGWRPFEISADAAAKRIVRGLARDHEVIAFPWPLVFAARMAAWMPGGIRRLALMPLRFYVTAETAERGAGPPIRSIEP